MTVWISTQTPFPNQQEIASAIKDSPMKRCTSLLRTWAADSAAKAPIPQAVEAARLAKITGKPVQVSFNRDEEFFYDAFRPAAVVKIKSGVDQRGEDLPLGQPHLLRRIEKRRAVLRCAQQPHQHLRRMDDGYGPKIHPFNIGAWRAPGANINVFARESQIDIMAAKLKMDPLEFRLKNSSDPRMRRVLEMAAKSFGYTGAVSPSGRGYRHRLRH